MATDGTGATLDCAAMRTDTAADPLSLQQCTQAYSYTANGAIATVADANGNLTTYVYDGYDRLAKTIFPSKTTIGQSDATDYEEYSYDANGNMISKRARSGATIAFLYDNLNRLLERAVPGAPTHTSALAHAVSHEFAYDLAGRRTLAKADGVALAYSYDGAGRLLSQTHNGAMAVAFAVSVRRTAP